MYAPKRNRLKREAEEDFQWQIDEGLDPEENTWLDLWAERLGRQTRKVGKKLGKKKKPPKKKEPPKEDEEA